MNELAGALPLIPIMGSGATYSSPGMTQEGHAGARSGLAETILRVFLSDGLNTNTRAARRSDLVDFCAYRVQEVDAAAVASLLQLSAGELRVLVEDYRADLRKRKLSDATVNRRLVTIRKLLGTCRDIGADVPDPKGIVIGEKVRAYRDTRGPGAQAVAQLLDSINRETLTGKRNYALLTLLYLSALRRGEVVKMDCGDVDLRRHRIRILGKGKGNQYEWFSLPDETHAALTDYIEARGQAAKTDPLFVSLSPTRPAGSRLSGRGIHAIVTGLGWDVLGEHVRPHALRHTAITEALDKTGGDVRRVQGYSRHANLTTLTHYDDSRRDHHGEIASVVADALKHRRAGS